MGQWWYRDIVEAGKLPLTLALIAFIGTFVLTRTVARLIRAGYGPFRNVRAGGLHIHHVVPGVLLMLVGGFGAFAAGKQNIGSYVLAVTFGTGAGLVLDEFALILHLDDVYWTESGRKSVEAVVLTASLVILLLLGFMPFGVDALSDEERNNRGALSAVVGFHLCCSLVALFKGKFRLGVLGILVPFMALIAAIRLARPESPWARKFYARRPRTRARALRRAIRHDARWGVLRHRIHDVLAGAPDRD
ncbi:hypothetical protein [Streptomyces gobiensis]|uniref:hypothetical protein n=1 Tax=Streptomyces gobiensis TaxID=2875706 RepID=UPI001E532A7F|nr:hypothetical protein [Streptomyces gobiensis]UGY90973.1 hypothetical protein test1122_04010 [Streptomyces gobiensis]